MKKNILYTLVICALATVACGQQRSASVNASEALSHIAATPEDQATASSLSDTTLTVTEGTNSAQALKLELGNYYLDVESVTEEGVALKINGVNVSSAQLQNAEELEGIIAGVLSSSQGHSTNKAINFSGIIRGFRSLIQNIFSSTSGTADTDQTTDTTATPVEEEPSNSSFSFGKFFDVVLGILGMFV